MNWEFWVSAFAEGTAVLSFCYALGYYKENVEGEEGLFDLKPIKYNGPTFKSIQEHVEFLTKTVEEAYKYPSRGAGDEP